MLFHSSLFNNITIIISSIIVIGEIMALSKRSIEILIDLLDVRISVLMINDQEDARELARLKKCKEELEAILKKFPSKISQYLNQ